MNPTDQPTLTPETDAEAAKSLISNLLVSAAFARRLERERDEAKATLAKTIADYTEVCLSDSEESQLRDELATAKTERDAAIADREKLEEVVEKLLSPYAHILLMARNEARALLSTLKP